MFAQTFLILTVMLFAARAGAMVERWRQPAVLGELLAGVLLGIFALKTDGFIQGVAEAGAILLLFRAGLESNVREMLQVGARAFIVAAVGVVLPFAGGYAVSAMLLPQAGVATHVFLGATLTATSVGITARVFQDLGILASREARIVLGAAVIDDVLGLVILAVAVGLASTGSVSALGVGWLSLKAALFLVGAVLLGQFAAPRLGPLLSRIHAGDGMKMAFALLFCGTFAWGAHALAGLAPIVGAFAAGLVLDPVHFSSFSPPPLVQTIRGWIPRVGTLRLADEMTKTADRESGRHVEQLIDGVSRFFVPVFFVWTGMQVDLKAFLDPSTLGLALALTAAAIVGKILCGLAAGKGTDRLLVGVAMIPRGEVGLIFANVGKELGVLDARQFAALVIVVILSTLVTPPVLGWMVRRKVKA